jgi:hypothetical protein
MKFLLTLILVVPLGASFTACGASETKESTGHRASGAIDETSSAVQTEMAGVPARRGRYFRGDADVDDRERPHPDFDERAMREYGHKLDGDELSAVRSLVKRYYMAAAGGDGVTACKLIYSRFRTEAGLAHAVPPDYAPAHGWSVMRGKKCVEVASLLLTLDNSQLVGEAPSVHVTDVRAKGSHGIALLAFRSTPERWISLERESRGWKLGAFLDSEIP